MSENPLADPRTFFVAGATGNVGRELAALLVAGGRRVRALVRAGREDVVPPGAEPVIGDLNEPASFAAALTGVDGAFLLSGYENEHETLRLLRDRGATRVALLSSSSVPGGEPDNAVTAYHAASEAAVEASGLAWTHLRPSSFMSNTLRLAPQLAAGDVVREPFGDVAVAVIDPRDVAAVAATALLTGTHDGAALRLTGPAALRPGDRVRILARVLGRDLRFEPLSDAEARRELAATMPEPYAEAFMRFFAGGTLDESIVLDTVAEVTGRPARRFEDWAIDHARAFG